jgi:hypothetical protein
VPTRKLDVAIRADQEQPHVGQLSGDVLEEEQRALVGGVKVLQNDNKWPRAARVLTETGDRIEEAKAGLRRVRKHYRGVELRQEQANVWNDRGDFRGTGSELCSQLIARTLAEVGAEDLDPGPVRRGATRPHATAPEHDRSGRRGPVGELFGEPALADPRFTADQDEPAAARTRVLERAEQRPELTLTANEERASPGLRRHGRRKLTRSVERQVLAEDRLLELSELRARLEAELVDESFPGGLVGGERLGLASRAIERGHELPVETLAQRVPGDKALELGHELAGLTEGEIRLNPLLQRRDPEFLEAPDLLLREPLERELR